MREKGGRCRKGEPLNAPPIAKNKNIVRGGGPFRRKKNQPAGGVMSLRRLHEKKPPEMGENLFCR